MPARPGEKYYGHATADRLNIGESLNIEFNQEEAMQFCMAILRAGIGMRHEENSFWVKLDWRRQHKNRQVYVGVFGYEKPRKKTTSK